MRRIVPIWGLLCFTATATAIELPALADATLRGSPHASNIRGQPQLQADATTQSLARFDLSAPPPGATASSAARATPRPRPIRVITAGLATIALPVTRLE